MQGLQQRCCRPFFILLNKKDVQAELVEAGVILVQAAFDRLSNEKEEKVFGIFRLGLPDFFLLWRFPDKGKNEVQRRPYLPNILSSSSFLNSR
jgi:endonuclease YncB( thermonuclease family)